MEKMKKKWKEKDPKLKCSSSSPLPLMALGELYAPTSTTHTKPHSQKKSPQELGPCSPWGWYERNSAFWLSQHALTPTDIITPFGEGSQRGKPYMDHQYICWASWPYISFHAAGTRIKFLFLSSLLSYLVHPSEDD